jgi:hypothetical protein
MTIKMFFVGAALIGSPFVLLPAMQPIAPAAAETLPAHSSATDFDIFYGRPWHVHNRRLAKRLAGSHDWVEFDAVDEFRPLPGGLGNQEIYRTDHWKDFVNIGVHLYNPQTQQWSLYSVDNGNAPGVLQAPVVGRFSGDTGLFFGADTFEGKPIQVRFLWKILADNHVTWEQAFSPDGGKTWEANWTMDFTR